MRMRKNAFGRCGRFDPRYVQLCYLKLILRVAVQEDWYWRHPHPSPVTNQNPSLRLPLLHRVKRRVRLFLESPKAICET